MSTLKAAILIVSTTASKDPSADSSGGILKDVFEQEGGGKWEVVDTKIVGDEVLDIQRSIMNWANQEDGVNLIVSTGGTGFAVHDSTPEVGNFLEGSRKEMLMNLRLLPLSYISMHQDLFMGCLRPHMQSLLVRFGFLFFSKSADKSSCPHVTASGWCPKQDHNHHSAGVSKRGQGESAVCVEIATSRMPSSGRGRLEIPSCRRCEKAGERSWS